MKNQKKLLKQNYQTNLIKLTIINDFSNKNNIFNKIQKINVILASKIYNLINENNSKINKSYSYQKILLEFSIFLEPKMDISKYALAEIYNFEKTL